MNLSSGLYHQIQCSVRFIHVLLLQNSSSNSPASANKHPQPKPATALPSSPSKLTPWPGNWSSPLCNISAGKVKGNVTNNLARKTWGRKKKCIFQIPVFNPSSGKARFNKYNVKRGKGSYTRQDSYGLESSVWQVSQEASDLRDPNWTNWSEFLSNQDL